MRIAGKWMISLFRSLGAIAILYCLFVFPTATRAAAQDWIYTVRPGDNLWDLSEEYLINMEYWPKLQAINEVADPEHMPPGRRLRFPVAWLKIQPAAVRVLTVQGKAEATVAATGQIVPLSVNLFLHAGDEVRTGPDGSAALEFADESQLLLQADSLLIMDTLSAYGHTGMVDTRLRLQGGRLDNRVTPSRGPGSRYEIWTPAAMSSVRGTDYRVSMEPAVAVARTEVLAGEVSVRGMQRTQLVPRGFGTVAKLGKTPETPVRLLAPPDVSALPKVVERVPIQLSFPALTGAVAYRAQIAPSREFNVLLFDNTFKLPHISGPDLPDGDYVLRVRGTDARGLEGFDAYHDFTLNARPEPPLLMEPRHNTTVYDKLPAFQWSEPENARRYHFQLASNDRFAAPIIDNVDYPQSRLMSDEVLQPGIYYWRVATRDTGGEEGPFSDSQQIKLLPAPKVEAPTITDNTMSLRWGADSPGQHYQFQLARDPAFEDIIVDSLVAEPQVIIQHPESGFHYLRIRTIAADGYAGSYGPTQRIDIPPQSYWPLIGVAVLVLVLAL